LNEAPQIQNGIKKTILLGGGGRCKRTKYNAFTDQHAKAFRTVIAIGRDGTVRGFICTRGIQLSGRVMDVLKTGRI